DQADDHVEAGGLAGAVGPEQADHFARFQRQAEVAHHLARAVTLGQAFGGEHQSPLAGRVLGRLRMFTRLPSPPPSRPPWSMTYLIRSPRRVPRGCRTSTAPVSSISPSFGR